MKHGKIKQISLLLTIAIVIYAAIPCKAMQQIEFAKAESMQGLLEWYGGLCGNLEQECLVTKPIECAGEVVFKNTPCRANIWLLSGLRIPPNARLTIDNPNLVISGPPPVITVEPGGVLYIKRINLLTAQAMPQGAILVQPGGTLIIEQANTFLDGMVTDQNLPADIPAPPAQIVPPNSLAPETPPAEEKLSIKGAVLKVTVQRTLLALITLPCVDPALIQSVTIQRSAQGQEWSTEYVYSWNENFLGFTSDAATEFGSLCSRNRSDGSKTDFQYMARLSDKPFYLRAVVTKTDGQQAISDEIMLTEPPVGQYPNEEYEGFDGNRGGGGQGTTDREEQKEAAPSRPDSSIPAEPQIPPHTIQPASSSAAQSGCTSQETASCAQSALPQAVPAAKQEMLPAAEQMPMQSEQAVLKQSTLQGSYARNWLLIAATLVLSGGIWIITIKRRRS